MLTSGTPFSRDASADGIQSTTTSAPPPAITCGGATSGTAGIDGHVEAGVLVKAFVLGDEIAGELGLRDPFELDRHLIGGVSGGERKPEGRRRRAIIVIFLMFDAPRR